MAETTKKKRFETIALAVLLVLLAIVVYRYRDREAAFAGIQTVDSAFRPLGVSDPALRLDLLDRLQTKEALGGRRNIFVDAPPPTVARAPKIAPVVQAPVIPQPIAPPPLVVPATLYGIVTEVTTGKRKAVFTSGDNDVYVVQEGGTLLGQYRVDKIGNNSVDVVEISSGRKTTLTLAAPVDSSQSN